MLSIFSIMEDMKETKKSETQDMESKLEVGTLIVIIKRQDNEKINMR